MQRIVIFGQGKTGTTALYYKIMEALQPTRVFEAFEPAAYSEPNDPNEFDCSLSKILLTNNTHIDFAKYSNFDNIIYLIRDPRDWILSAVLFRMRSPQIAKNKQSVSRILNILKRKEAAPESISFLELFEEFTISSEQDIDSIIAWIRNLYIWLHGFEQYYDHALTFRYEDLVDSNLSELSQYLKLPLSQGHVTIPDPVSHVIRTRSYNHWRDWFVESDVAVFKPLFDRYIDRHGYSQNWNVNNSPILDPKFGSEYVAKNMSELY